jgi:hypothetical protein
LKTHHLTIALLAVSAAASCFAVPDGTAQSGALPTNTTRTAVEAVAEKRANLQRHNAALMSRSELCTKRVREGVIKPTGSAQFACLMGSEPK